MINEIKFSSIKLLSYNYTDDVYLYEVGFNNKLKYYYVVVQNTFIYKFTSYKWAIKKFQAFSYEYDKLAVSL